MNTARDPSEAPERIQDGLLHDQRRARRPNTTVPLQRSRTQRVLAGVCGGIAEYVDAAPATVRAVFLVTLVPSIGVTGLGYLLLWWLLPVAPPT